MIEAACCGRKVALKDRIAKLEQMVGRLTMENEFLKKALENTSEKAE